MKFKKMGNIDKKIHGSYHVFLTSVKIIEKLLKNTNKLSKKRGEIKIFFRKRRKKYINDELLS